MSKNLLFILACSLLLLSCTPQNGVEFNKVASIELGNLKKEQTKLNAILLFNNISENSFVVKNIVLDLKIDGKDIGTILVKQPKEVRAHSEFSIPISYAYDTQPIINPGEEPADVYLVQLSGDLTLKDKNGEEFTVGVSYKEPYAYLTKKEERIDKRKERKEAKQKAKEQAN